MDQRRERATKSIRGSTLIESAISSAFVTVTVTTSSFILYFAFTKVFSKSAIYDGLICIAEEKRTSVCEDLVRKRISYLPIGSVQKISLRPNGKGELTFVIDPNFKLHVTQEIPGDLL
jgi:hypothetical protein